MTESIIASFEGLIKDILMLNDIMISIRSAGGVAELRLDKDTPFRIKYQWATIGDEKGQWHLHINIYDIKVAKFIVEDKEDGRKSYSIRFFNSNNDLILRVNFLKMYTPEKTIIPENISRYKKLFSKYGENQSLTLTIKQID